MLVALASSVSDAVITAVSSRRRDRRETAGDSLVQERGSGGGSGYEAQEEATCVALCSGDLHPTHYTYTLHPTPYTLHPTQLCSGGNAEPKP